MKKIRTMRSARDGEHWRKRVGNIEGKTLEKIEVEREKERARR